MVTGMGGPDIRQALVYRFWLGCISIMRCDATHGLFIVVEPACRCTATRRPPISARLRCAAATEAFRQYQYVDIEYVKPDEPMVHELFEHIEHSKNQL